MSFREPINLFELNEKVVERVRVETGITLLGHDLSWRCTWNWNNSKNQIYLWVSIFQEEYTFTCFDKERDTTDKMVEMLFVKLMDDTMVSLRDVLIGLKCAAMETRLKGLTEQIHEIVKSNGISPLAIIIDEKFPYHQFQYENGFPVLQYQIRSVNDGPKLFIDLDYNFKGLNQNVILEKVKAELLSKL